LLQVRPFGLQRIEKAKDRSNKISKISTPVTTTVHLPNRKKIIGASG
jgi:hypothetical protein